MNKKIMCLILCGLLALPLVGCNSHLTINGKELFNFGNDKKDEVVEEQETVKTKEYSNTELIEMTKKSVYTLKIDNEVADQFIIEEIINEIYEEPYWQAFKMSDNSCQVMIHNMKEGTIKEYIYFYVDLSTGIITVTEVLKDGVIYEDDEARSTFANMLVELSDKITKNETETEEKTEEKKAETKKEDKGEDPMAETNGKHNVELDYVCAQCGTRMYNTMLDGTHEDEFCSVTCQNNWYSAQKEMNEKKYNCKWCGNSMNESQYDTWGGCCSEYCAVQLEGTAFENNQRDELNDVPEKDENMYNGEVPDGGCTICGWCGARVTGDGAFCSDVCEKAHHDYYNVN